MTRTAARLEIEGRVQGGGYRWWVVEWARAHGLDGWVRNRQDGLVEVLAIGDAATLAALESACRAGPRHARVTAVRRAAAADDGSQGFEQRATA